MTATAKIMALLIVIALFSGCASTIDSQERFCVKCEQIKNSALEWSCILIPSTAASLGCSIGAEK